MIESGAVSERVAALERKLYQTQPSSTSNVASVEEAALTAAPIEVPSAFSSTPSRVATLSEAAPAKPIDVVETDATKEVSATVPAMSSQSTKCSSSTSGTGTYRSFMIPCAVVAVVVVGVLKCVVGEKEVEVAVKEQECEETDAKMEYLEHANIRG